MIIHTTIPSLCLTAALPDEIRIGTLYSIIGIKVKVGSEVVWTNELYSYQNVALLYDIRTVIEAYMRANDESYAVCQIIVTEDGTDQNGNTFEVIISDIDIPSAATWLTTNFLTTSGAQRISKNGKQQLTWYAAEDESITYKITAINADNETSTWNQQAAEMVDKGIYEYLVDVAEIESHFNDDIIAFTVQRGANRSITFFVVDENPAMTVKFRNNFNVMEYAELFVDTNKKVKMESSEAKSLRRIIKYDFEKKEQFEVESGTISLKEAKWLEQMLTSRYVAKKMPDGGWKEIIIDGEAEVNDKANGENKVKFSYQYERNIQYI